MSRLYTEIRIHHNTESDKKKWEKKVTEKVKEYGFSSRAEFIKVVCVNAKINIKEEEK